MIERGKASGLLRKYLKKGDIAVIAALLGLSLLLGIAPLCCRGAEGRACAVVTRGGAEIARLPLDEDTVYVISDADAHNVIEIADGAVRMAEADCPDGLCVASGAISGQGQIIVCLPKEIVITVESEQEPYVDTTAY